MLVYILLLYQNYESKQFSSDDAMRYNVMRRRDSFQSSERKLSQAKLWTELTYFWARFNEV